MTRPPVVEPPVVQHDLSDNSSLAKTDRLPEQKASKISESESGPMTQGTTIITKTTESTTTTTITQRLDQ